ncbi:EAL domain-containing protein [Piscinibacter sp. XHJ-5]|uniref:putative bifunctional diguanylate cyclase/phosphodiesterase n=1 Tax=Piscinibacter sp. XHJ-5 TaxID=3037797 RepID=UPI002452C6C9|nr:EAL domain-containing protein [Piscinibacter sp. XHJ-5]
MMSLSTSDSVLPGMLPSRRRRGSLLRNLVLWLAGALIALVLAGALMGRAAESQLHADAEHVALQWAELVKHSVPDLDAAFSSGEFTPATLERLRDLRHAGEVFRFKFYDRAGTELLVSDSLADPAFVRETARRRLGEEEGQKNATVRPIVLGGRNHIELKRASRPDRPAVYSEAYVPVVRDGRVLGVVEVYVDQTVREARIGTAFRKVALGVLAMLLAMVAAGAWQWSRHWRRQHAIEAQVRYLARHDVLTGTLNRASFAHALQQAAQRACDGGPSFAVLCIDLDRFKEVNDSLGHAAGDQMLRTVAARLRASVREHDVVARLGGDEFAVLQADVDRPDVVLRLAQRIVAALGEGHSVHGHDLRGGASVGAAIYGRDTADIEELLHRADSALYRAKVAGRGRFSFYDETIDRQLQERRTTARDLREALHRQQLDVHFQALYESDGRTLAGYEALVRWTHPQRGPIPPNEFIPLAEETGLIEELGHWVLCRACTIAAGWPPSLSVSVNLSAMQFRSGDLVPRVAQSLRDAGLPATRLELEITESLLMNNTEQVIRSLHELTDMGVRIVMDDFGTGYSSLAYLWRFPFDKVKIDRAFTQNLESDPKVAVIVRSIVSLAHSLNIRVNAEGVESPAQLRALQRHGCDELQGFLLARPAPNDKLQHAGAPHEARTTLPRAQTDFAPLDS